MNRRSVAWRLVRKATTLCAAVWLLAVTCAAQTAVVVRNTNLRADPSSYEDPIELLTPDTKLTLLRPKPKERYYKVRTPEGREGWVYGSNIRVQGASDEDDESGTTATGLPTVPDCDDDGEHSRHVMKTRAKRTGQRHAITVGDMLKWRVPVDLDALARTSDDPIAPLEEQGHIHELTGYVRKVKLEADCDFHVQVASSRGENASEVIVEIPRVHETAQRQLMGLLGMKNAQKSRTYKFPTDPPRLTFVGLAFLDQWHQTKKPTQAGTGHGPASVKTLWELHPIWEVRRP